MIKFYTIHSRQDLIIRQELDNLKFDYYEIIDYNEFIEKHIEQTPTIELENGTRFSGFGQCWSYIHGGKK